MNCSNPSIYTVCNSNVVPDPSESRKYIKDIVRECFGMIAKEEQVEVLRNLVFDKQDTILIAKTGFGKSLIFLATPPIVGHDSTAVIVMPLLELEAEQCRKLQKIAGCRPFVLNGESNTTQNRQDVKIGKYTHGAYTGY